MSSDPLLDSRLTSFRLLGKEFSGVEALAAEMFSKLSNLDLLDLSKVLTGLLVVPVLLLFSRELEAEETLLLSALDLSSVLEAELVIIRLCLIIEESEGAMIACLGLKSVRPGMTTISSKCQCRSFFITDPPLDCTKHTSHFSRCRSSTSHGRRSPPDASCCL